MSAKGAIIVIGIDVGTSGVRAVAADAHGTVLTGAACPLPTASQEQPGIHEQDPADWWRVLCSVTANVTRSLQCHGSVEIGGISLVSTSGSLVLVDGDSEPVRPAIMYNDCRGTRKTPDAKATLSSELQSAHALMSAVWVQKAEPQLWQEIRCLLPPAAWLTGCLTGEFGSSDASNALKLGYSPDTNRWSGAVTSVGVPLELLPSVVPSGQQVGNVFATASAESGLPTGVPVFAGATDGMASLLASGASRPGDANTTLGTTLVWKVLVEEQPVLTMGLYAHRHPSGLWAPGSASNSGPGSLRYGTSGLDAAEFDRLAEPHLPSPVLCYLLQGQGERFPFWSDHASTFVEGKPRETGEWYAAQLQSLAFVERWGYEVLEQQAVRVGDVVFSTGGAAQSPVLSRLRASVLQREVVNCKYPVAAFGAAIIAGSGAVYGGDFRTAIESMTSRREVLFPSADLKDRYDEIYENFRETCARRGYSN